MQHPRSKGGLGPMNVPVIADITKAISRSYGVLVEDPADGMCGLALRGTFIIAPNGVVRSVQVNDDQVGRNVDETLRLLQAFQYADEHGEVCPSKWKPGAATMVPNPVGSKAYFSGVPDAAGSGAAAAASLGAK
jgi:peroxiredoxin (alkyl hydroperoxide reductase subunit C)